MFSAYCKHCGTVVLLDPANVHSIHNTSAGIVLHFRCHAGHSGTWLAGRRSPGQTRGTGGPGAVRGAAPRAASGGGAPGGRRSWWPRAARERPRARSRQPGPGHGGPKLVAMSCSVAS